MSSALNPAQIFERAAEEGKRRLNQGLLELLATGFIAGLTIVLGSTAQALIESRGVGYFGEFASVLGALGFGVGVVFLILGRAELFSENFFDPIATAFERKEPHMARRLARLWVLTFVLNIVGGGILVAVLSVEGALPVEARHTIAALAHELAGREVMAVFARSIVGGALVALLSFFVAAAQSTGARMMAAYAVGVLLALGPFEHVVVSTLHLLFGLGTGAELGAAEIVRVAAVALAGNMLGGIGLVTLSHAAQAMGEEEEDE